MAKDPAFLFYSQDWIVGCQTLTMAERGQYITLIAMMHQQGRMDTETIRLLVGSVSDRLMAKFACDSNGFYYHERLETEVKNRQKFVESRRINGLSGGRPKGYKGKTIRLSVAKPTVNLMANENENENEIENSNKKGAKFTPPTGQQVADWFVEHCTTWPVAKCHQQAQKFYDHYTTVGWLVGKAKHKMKNWHTAASGWATRTNEYDKTNNTAGNTGTGKGQRVGRMAAGDLQDFLSQPIPDIKI
jgi:hypothetical protein